MEKGLGIDDSFNWVEALGSGRILILSTSASHYHKLKIQKFYSHHHPLPHFRVLGLAQRPLL